MRSVYKRHTRPSDLVPVELFNGIVKTLNAAISDDFTAEYPDLCETLRSGNEVFAAFKVHDQCERMARLLTHEDGNLKSFEQWVREAEPISNHHNKVWLRTEYDTAIKRAEQAREWKQFEAERDVLPNLRWVPSTAAKPGADHMVFWDVVRPIDDPFWSHHRPGDRWGCQCSLEATDDPATAVPPSGAEDEAAPGLDGNPATTGNLFSDSHPYYPSSCGTCPFNTGGTPAVPTNKTKDCYNCPFIKGCISRIGAKKDVDEGKAERLREILKNDLMPIFDGLTPCTNLTTQKILRTKKSRHALTFHCHHDYDLDVAVRVWNSPDELGECLRIEAVGSFHEPGSKNVMKKKESLTGYGVYEVIDGDRTFIVKTAIHKKGFEFMYAIYEK